MIDSNKKVKRLTKQQLQLELEHTENCLDLIYENCKIIEALSGFKDDKWRLIRNHTIKEFKDFGFDCKLSLATDYTTYFRNYLIQNANLKKRELNKLMKEVKGE